MSNLPPTFNDLPPSQRSRLIHSTRKLGNIFGTTPHLLESSEVPILPSRSRHGRSKSEPVAPATKSISRPRTVQKSVDSVKTRRSAESDRTLVSENSSNKSLTPSSSSSSLPPDLKKSKRPTLKPTTPLTNVVRTRHHPAPLFLKLDTPSTPSAASIPPQTPTTPSSATFPSTPVPTSREAMRRKMAKLARHLGENPPSELVFPTRPRARRPSTDQGSQEAHVPMPFISTTVLRHVDPTPPYAGVNRRSSRKLTPRPNRTSWRLSGHRSSGAFNSYRVNVTNPKRSSGSGNMSPSRTGDGTVRTKAGPTRDWTGEWNRNDIVEVQAALRGLKVR